MSESIPTVWSDFDGTAVKLPQDHRGYGVLDPRIWCRDALKYPLDLVAGYPDFLRGLQASTAMLAGIVSRRAGIRRAVTRWSFAAHGLAEFFPDGTIVLAGSESKKAQHVVDAAQKSSESSSITPVALIEDRPQRFGKPALQALVKAARVTEARHNPIVVGVTHHPRSQQYIDSLLAFAQELQLTVDGATLQESVISDGEQDFRFTIPERSSLHIVQLPPYGHAAGQAFGETLLSLST